MKIEGWRYNKIGRLKDRGVTKKDRGDRDRERERERSSWSKRKRKNRMLIRHVTTGSNRDDGDDTSEGSVNDEDEDDDDAGNDDGLRMLPSLPTYLSTPASSKTSNHHNHNPHPQQLHYRKSFLHSASKVFRAAAAPPLAWNVADEMIDVSVPWKARLGNGRSSRR
ncbi:hypothetical protein L2E82_17979 [Cichorium intybus]|uniref:Uncharacterized protein n=1 Tax=Cichorium intybus TaxID=13427 RepID=A0ACB9F8I8_CICIN|nr:hypothetical protein L2E82_17979 [Cichorium intybus]